MAGKEESSSFSRRLARLSSRFEQKAEEPKSAYPREKFRHIFLRDIRELFTLGITREGMDDLLRRDTRETLQFYARHVDLEALRSLPWYQRHPQAAWKIFVALAHRLSPPRRIAFAVAVFSLLIGWVEFILFLTSAAAGNRSSGAFWLAISFAILIMLLFIELRDKLDLKGDLEIAREIQFGLVPTEPFIWNGLNIHHLMRPANTVGGDYFDIIRLEEDRIAIVVGDVSGKGMPAALLMALLLGSLRTLVAAGLRGAELITRLNDYLSTNIPPGRLVTLFYGELDLPSGLLTYVNAGHNAPYLMRQGTISARLNATSLVLGIDVNARYETRGINIQSGDRLLLFTDGITEAFNEREEEYGEDRLANFLQKHANAEPRDLLQSLVNDVLKFCSSAKPSDDMTMMIITKMASPA